MPVSKTRKINRKTAKQYRMVKVASDLFDAELVLPDFAQIPMGVPAKMTKGDLGAMFDWLRAAGVDGETIEAVESLDGEEFDAFSTDWGKGSSVDLPKSSD
jgi:hypothetical protein